MQPRLIQRLSVSLALSVLLGAGCASPNRSKRVTPLPASHGALPDRVQGSAGLASWYGEEHRGKPMANGQPFDPAALTAASWFFPLGTRVRVTCGHRSVTVEITDRGPAQRLVQQGRVIDLSHAAFARLSDPKRGLIPVEITPVK